MQLQFVKIWLRISGHQMEIAEKEHQIQLSRKEHEEKLFQKVKSDEQEVKHLEHLKNLGVDLTKMMTAQLQKPESIIQIVSDDQTKPKVVLHHGQKEK